MSLTENAAGLNHTRLSAPAGGAALPTVSLGRSFPRPVRELSRPLLMLYGAPVWYVPKPDHCQPCRRWRTTPLEVGTLGMSYTHDKAKRCLWSKSEGPSCMASPFGKYHGFT